MTKRELQNKIKAYKNLYNSYIETNDSSLKEKLKQAYQEVDFEISVKHLIDQFKNYFKDEIALTTFKISEEPDYQDDFSAFSTQVNRLDGVVMSHKAKTYPIFQLRSVRPSNKGMLTQNEILDSKISLLHALYCSNAFTNKMEKRKHFKDFEGLQDCVYEALKLTIIDQHLQELAKNETEINELENRKTKIQSFIQEKSSILTDIQNSKERLC